MCVFLFPPTTKLRFCDSSMAMVSFPVHSDLVYLTAHQVVISSTLQVLLLPLSPRCGKLSPLRHSALHVHPISAPGMGLCIPKIYGTM
jgi:hypothetical protein